MADPESEQEIFDSVADTDEASTPEPEQGTGEQPRDEHGRFATRVVTDTNESDPPQPQPNQPAAEQEQRPQPETAPAWALEERRRRQEAEQQYQQAQRQLAEMQGRIAAQEAFLARAQQPQQQEPQQPPDFFENPQGFVQAQFQQYAQQFIHPLERRLTEQEERWSQRYAEKEWGPETVQAAKQWIETGVQSRDPEATMVLQRAMSGPDPYGTLVQLYRRNQVIKQIGDDPVKWAREAWLPEASKDPNFQREWIQKYGPAAGSVPTNRGGAPLVSIPSINRASGSAATPSDSAPASEEDIFAAAPRRMGRRD